MSSPRQSPSTETGSKSPIESAHGLIAQYEAALDASEARFRNLVELNGDAIVVVSEDGAIRYANAMAGQMFGTPAARLVGAPFGFPLISGETTELDIVVDGAPRLAEMRVTASTWDDAPVKLAMLRDITHLDVLRNERAAQAAERLADARLREMVSQAPVAFAVLRGADHTFEITNTLYQELIGHREVVGKPVREALPELKGQGIYELMDQVYTTGVPYVGSELRLMIERHPGLVQETFFTFVYQPLRESDGAVSAIAIVATDVTPQVQARTEVERVNEQLERQTKTLERQFAEARGLAKALEATNARVEEARAEAEEANRAKSDFLATMSHELRTPLNAIGGYADLILAGIRGPINAEQETDLERIKRSQRHLLAVINDILNFAKVEAGRLELHLADVSMNEALGGLESLVAPTLLEKKIAYEYLCCDPSYHAHVDPERLQQILLNLLANAVKFTPPGGRITVECGATESSMVVRVSDTGVGIAEDKLQQIFEPFVQLEHGQARGMSGTGLGLAISRDLARAMGGDLTAESSLGNGATFTLTVPRVAPSADCDQAGGLACNAPRATTESPDEV